MAFFSKKQHEWNPPWKSADKVFSEDFGKLLIKDLKYLKLHPERWECTYLRISDLNTAKNLTSNRPYCGDNQTLLKKHTSTHLYAMPVYVTEKQLAYRYPKAKILYKDAWINITYYNKTYKDKNGNEITEAKYNAMSPAERKTVKISKSEQTAKVYNIDATNLKQIEPAVYQSLQRESVLQAEKRLKSIDASGMYIDPAIEKTMENWPVPISESDLEQYPYHRRPYQGHSAFIKILSKERYVTVKTSREKYINGLNRINTIIHECLHSTGPKLRPKKYFETELKGEPGRKAKAREELVAETGAMMICAALGFPARVLRNSERYLNSWLDHDLLKDPNFFKSVLEDARKACKEFIKEYNIQAQKLGEPTIKLPPDSAYTKKKPLIKRVLAGIGNLTQRFVNMFGHHGGRNQQSSPDKTTEASEKKSESALNAPGTRESSMEKEVPPANARETGTAERTEASAAAERTTGLAGTNRNGKADTGVSQLSPEDAEDRRIEQLIAQKCPTASRENIEHIRDIIKQRVEIAKQQGGGLRIVDGKAQSLNERTGAPKEQDRSPRTASRT